MARIHRGRTTAPNRKMLPVAEKSRSFSRGRCGSARFCSGPSTRPWSAPCKIIFYGTEWRATGNTEAYIPLEQWALATLGSDWPSRSGQFKLCHFIKRRNTLKAYQQNAARSTMDIQGRMWNQDISARGPCLCEFREFSLLPHLSSRRLDTF